MRAYAMKRKVPVYYKLGTEPNGTITGSVSVDANGVASGFTTSQYITTNGGSTVSADNLKSFEVQVKVTTPSSWTESGRIINPTNGADSTTAPFIYIVSSAAGLNFYNGSTYMVLNALNNVSTNTTYWFKWIYDGSVVKCYYSIDGNEFILNSEVTPAYKPFFNSSQFSVGCRSYDKYAGCVWNGSIDLKECYIKLNNKFWWSGTKYVRGSVDDYVYYDIDIPTYTMQRQGFIYYKYDYQSWSRPNLGSNGTMGGSSFAVASSAGSAAAAFDGDGGSYTNYMNAGNWISWYNPDPLKISSVVLYSSGASYMPRAGRLQYSDDNANWATAVTWSNPSSSNPFTIANTEENHHKFWRIYVDTKGTNSGNSDFSNIVINAQKAIVVQSTKEDHVFHKPDITAYMAKVRKG